MRGLFATTVAAIFFAACSGAHASHSHRPDASPRPTAATVPSTASTGQVVPGQRLVSLDLPAPLTDLTPALADAASTSGETAVEADIANAPSGSVIHLASGTYGQIDDETNRSGWVTISGQGDQTPPVIEGAALYGARYVRFVDVEFVDGVAINQLNSTQLAAHVAVIDSVIDCHSRSTTPFTMGIGVRGQSSYVTFAGDLIYRCVTGFTSEAQDPLSSHIRLVSDTFEDLTGDAIDLGGLAYVTIKNDVIRHMVDPAQQFHNDGIQFFGNDHHVTIADNVLANSRSQLIFIQDAVAGTVSGVRSNTDILISHNLIYGDAGVAIQDQGGINVTIVGNTIWDVEFGGLWLVRSTFSGQPPRDTVIVDNIIQGFALQGSPPPGLESHNVIEDGPAHYHYGSGDIVDVNPEFVDPDAGNFALAPSSPARAQGIADSAEADDAARGDLSVGTTGSLVSIGALQPDAPRVSDGAPTYTTGSSLTQYPG